VPNYDAATYKGKSARQQRQRQSYGTKFSLNAIDLGEAIGIGIGIRLAFMAVRQKFKVLGIGPSMQYTTEHAI
jgi:hypothetical protein